MSVLQYGEINLGLVKSVKLDQRPKYEDAGTDVQHFTTVLRAETIFTVLDNGLGIPNILVGEKTPAEIMRRLQHMLLQPRQPLLYAPGGGVLINIPDGLDSNNGPRPLDCNIAGITERTFRVEWSVEVAQPCPGVKQLFATNRWEAEHSIDKRGYSTITTTGTVTTRSDMRINPDQLRGICAPPLLNDFRRSYRFRLSRDGLSLNYQVDDEQAYLLPPLGIVGEPEMDGGIVSANGGSWQADVRLSMEGMLGLKKKTLMEMAVLMVLRKLESYGPVQDKNGHPFITGGSFREKCFENKVEVHLRALVAQSPRVFKPGVAFDAGKFFFDANFGNIKAAEEFFNGKKDETAKRKAKLDQERADTEAKVRAEHAALVKSPPFARLGDPPVLTETDADGLDPGVRGNIEFFEMLAAAFRDPCFPDPGPSRLVQKNRRPIPPAPSGGLVTQGVAVTLAEARLRTQAAGGGTSVLRSFVITDSGQFDKTTGLAGHDRYPGVYEFWYCDIVQEVTSFQGGLPTTVPGGIGRRFQTANPVNVVTYTWSNRKYGAPPEVPVVADDNLVHVRTKIRMSTVYEAGDGSTPVYETSGVSEYTALDPARVAMRPAVPPWMNVEMYKVPGPIPRLLDLSTDSGGSSSLRSRGQA